jgi:acylglycerol lipase
VTFGTVTLHTLRKLLLLAALAGLAACTPRLEPAGPAIQPPAIEIVQRDGAVLPLRTWLPEKDPRAVIVALHGFNDYSRAFEKPGAYWATRGIATYAFDQRGFGAAPHVRIWAGHRTMVADTVDTLDAVRARHPGKPVFLLGESMGGAIAMIAATDTKLAVDGLILVAPALRGRRYLGLIPRNMLWLAYHTVPGFPLSGRGLKIQASDNIKMLRQLGADPLVLKGARVDTVKGLVDAMDAAAARAPELYTRSLILYGSRDELVPKQPTFDMIRAVPADAGHRPAVYRNGWHLLLRDLKAKTVLDDIAAWIADSSAPLPSGADRTAAEALAGAAETD